MRLLVISLLLLQAGCADLGYYWHTASGHLAIMAKRVPVETLLADSELDEPLRQRLVLSEEIRRFSVERLALPDNGSYTDYAELDQPYALQNLFAAPEFSTKLLSWCYPVAGCTSYRGFYEKERLDRFTGELAKDGHDIYVGPVPAYSTLGWFDDPLLSSFIHWPEFRLAGLLFHELTHQRIYIDGDSRFNESLATAVQQVGTRLWLESRGQAVELEEFRRSIDYRRDIVEMIEDTRQHLTALYRSALPAPVMREHKQRILDEARQGYEKIASQHGYRDGFAHWFAGELNNAKLASVSTYHAGVPAFVNMIIAYRRDFDAFFDYVEALGEMERAQRDACLQAWGEGPAYGQSSCDRSLILTRR